MTCRAVGCSAVTDSGKLMCPKHWYMIPAVLRTQIYMAYRPDRITQEWIDLTKKAINYVAQVEGQPLLPDTEQLIIILQSMTKGE